MNKKLTRKELLKGLESSNPYVQQKYYDFVISKIFAEGETKAGVNLAELFNISKRSFYYALRDKLSNAELGECRKNNTLEKRYYKRNSLMSALHMLATLVGRGHRVDFFTKIKSFKYDEKDLNLLMCLLSEDAGKYERSLLLMRFILCNNENVKEIEDAVKIVKNLVQLSSYDLVLVEVLARLSTMDEDPMKEVWPIFERRYPTWGVDYVNKVLGMWKNKFTDFYYIVSGLKPLFKGSYPPYGKLCGAELLAHFADDKDKDGNLKLEVASIMMSDFFVNKDVGQSRKLACWRKVTKIFSASKYPDSNTFMVLEEMMGYKGDEKKESFFTVIKGDYPQQSQYFSAVLKDTLAKYANGEFVSQSPYKVLMLCIRLSRFALNCYDFEGLEKKSFELALAAELKRIEPASVMAATASRFLQKLSDIPYQPGDQASEMIIEMLQKTAYKGWYQEPVKIANWCRELGYPRPIFRPDVEEQIKDQERMLALLEQ